jgi:BirA family transcriptional regulator, biotin operon repressor / biotin---[acetyl-CoA-carboxylase] ligase
MQLDPAAAATGVRLLARDLIGSTNADALERARAGERGPLWITARAQSAGRGRRGNVWISEPGNLYATLLLGNPASARRLPQLSFVAALAVIDAIGEAAPRLASRLALKWPNDVLCDGAKIAGTLLEGEGQGRDVAVAVGIGVNCAHHPAGMPYPVTNLAAEGASVSPDQLFRALSGAMARRLAQWDRGAGFEAIRADWLARAAGVGSAIRVRLPEREISGRFEALDEDGRLMLRLPEGRIEPVTVGEVFGLNIRGRPATQPESGEADGAQR